VPSLRIDLHSHSTYSDGTLSPAALVQRAAARQVTMLALTDHDEVGGLEEAGAAAAQAGIHLVPGVEISVSWSAQTIHVLGLGIDRQSTALAQGLASLRASRRERAMRIATQLDAAGIPGSLDGAARFAANGATIGRSHFARYLVEQGIARDTNAVFRKYLATGKPGYVPHEWANLQDAIGWIRQAGGQAVLAHPERYRLSSARLRHLLQEFRDSGGAALEIGASLRADPTPQVRLAEHFGLAVSVGSDFHAPAGGGVDLGDTAHAPPGCRAVWDLLEAFRIAA